MTGSDTPTTPYEYESEQPPSLAVITALAELEEVEPTDLEYTLFDYIDPQALDMLTQSATAEITFTIGHYTVHITAANTVRITA